MSIRFIYRHIFTIVIIAMVTIFAGIFISGAKAQAASGSINISSPKPYAVIQRDGNNQANIVVKGTYKGTPKTIQARWRGSSWQNLDVSPTGGRYAGTLTNKIAGQGTLEVRFSSNTNIKASNRYVGIGDIYVIAGDSNGSSRGINNQRYNSRTLKATMFANDYHWKELKDPVDSTKGQIDMASYDNHPGGSPWPIIATKFMASQKVPIAFIPTAKSSTRLFEWQKNSNPKSLYNTMAKRINASGGKVKLVILSANHNDARLGLSKEEFKRQANQFADSVKRDFGVPVSISQMNDWRPGQISVPQINTIRQAHTELVNEYNNIIAGPAMYDINLRDEGGDSVHYRTNYEISTEANRWWAAIKSMLYANSDGVGPKIVSATTSSDKKAITLTFYDDSLPLKPSSGINGFIIKDNSGIINIKYSKVINRNQVNLALYRSINGTASVSYGDGRTAKGSRVLKDSSVYNLPAETFYNYKVN